MSPAEGFNPHQVTEADLARPGTVYQISLPPRRVDVLNQLSGVSFDEAQASRLTVTVDGMAVPFLGRDKDLVDVKVLEGSAGKPAP